MLAFVLVLLWPSEQSQSAWNVPSIAFFLKTFKHFSSPSPSSLSVPQLRSKGPVRGTSAAHEQWGKSTKPCHDDVIRDTSTTMMMRKWPLTLPLHFSSHMIHWGGLTRLASSTVQIPPPITCLLFTQTHTRFYFILIFFVLFLCFFAYIKKKGRKNTLCTERNLPDV